MLIRRPFVAGSFYPSEPSEIISFCAAHLAPSGNLKKVCAAVLPHAGYIYSGKTACKVLSLIEIPETVVMIGPNHRGFGSDFALFPQGEWQTPLGSVPIAQDICSAFLKASSLIKKDDQAHAIEHSLEVILPMLQYKNPKLRIAPLIVATLDFREAAQVAKQLSEILPDRSESFLIVISNDMSHYEEDAATRKKDRFAIDAILNLDAEGLIQAVKEHGITMCGLVPVYMLLTLKDALKIKKATLVDYSTSAEASGDTNRVVGYAGFIFE